MTSPGFELPRIGIATALLAIAGGLIWISKVAGKEIVAALARHSADRFIRSARFLRGREVRRYAKEVARKDNQHPLGFSEAVVLKVDSIFVPLHYEAAGDWGLTRFEITPAVVSRNRVSIIGNAGAGKSILLKQWMVSWSKNSRALPGVPVLVELHRFNDRHDDLVSLIAESFERRQTRKPVGFWRTALEHGKLSLLLDGLDEVLHPHRSHTIQEVLRFADTYPNVPIVLTCRTALYPTELAAAFGEPITIAGFDDFGMRLFVQRWLKSTGRTGHIVREYVEQFMHDLSASPALLNLAASPLMLTMMTTLYNASGARALGTTRAEFYGNAIEHMLRRDKDMARWGELGVYDPAQKMRAIRRIALDAQKAVSTSYGLRALEGRDLMVAMSSLMLQFNLEPTDARPMFAEIVDRSELLVCVDKANMLYEFRHLTLQEYLAAVELADDSRQLLELYSKRPGRWSEVVKLWCGGARRDSSPLIARLFDQGADGRTLALECVAEATDLVQCLSFEFSLG